MKDEYFAGLFDGEGCISTAVQRVSHGYKCYNMQPQLSIGMTNCAYPLILEINAQYGGTLYHDKRTKPGWQSATYVRWRSRVDVALVLDKLTPHLILKKEQARLTQWWVQNITDADRWGIQTAMDIFTSDLQRMKGNMALNADLSIERIKDCFQLSNVVSIR